MVRNQLPGQALLEKLDEGTRVCCIVPLSHSSQPKPQTGSFSPIPAAQARALPVRPAELDLSRQAEGSSHPNAAAAAVGRGWEVPPC